MNRILRWALSNRWLRGLASIVANNNINPRSLEEAMRQKLSPGTPKTHVIEFVQSLHPFRCEDYGKGKRLVVRWLEETGDLVRSWDIEVSFKFDEQDCLLEYSQYYRDFIDYEFDG
jgi:hypothetical protein